MSVVYCVLLLGSCFMFIACGVRCVVRCLLFVACCSMRVVYCLVLFAVPCLLFGMC